MTHLQLELIHKREVNWDRALLALFLVFQITCTIFIYIHDSQAGFIPFAILTTTVKSIIVAAIALELIKVVDLLLKKYWLNRVPTTQ